MSFLRWADQKSFATHTGLTVIFTQYLRQMNLLLQVPNILTLSNLFFGTLGVIAVSLDRIPDALILMAICLVADIFDGAIARKLNIAGPLGVQLDSLADIVSFGVLPGMMIFYMGTRYGGADISQVAVALSGAAVATSAGFRLARFNIDERPREFFWGLATPAGAMIVAGWLWVQYIGRDLGLGVADIPLLIFFLPLFLIVAYQAPVKLPGLKSPIPGLVTAGVIAFLTLAGFFIIGPVSISLGLLLYYISGLLNYLIKWY